MLMMAQACWAPASGAGAPDAPVLAEDMVTPHTTAATSHTITLTSLGLVDGNLLLHGIVIAVENGTATTPSGSTLVGNTQIGAGIFAPAYTWRRAQGVTPDTSVAVGISGSRRAISFGLRISGWDTTTPVEGFVEDNGGSADAIVVPGITTTGAKRLCFCGFSKRGQIATADHASLALPSPWTVVLISTTANSNGTESFHTSMGLGVRVMDAAGTTAAATWTGMPSAALAAWSTWGFAVRPTP